MLNFRTGFVRATGEEVLDGARVARRYLRTWFAVDLLASVPFDELFSKRAAGAAASGRLLRMGKSLKVLKMVSRARARALKGRARRSLPAAEEAERPSAPPSPSLPLFLPSPSRR